MLIELFLLMHPALVPVFMREFGLSIFEAGLIITVPNVCRLFFVLPTGIFSDKFGPRRLIILSMLMSGVGALLVSQSKTVSVLVFSLSMIMISVTLYHAPGLSIISGLFSNEKERSAAIGLHGAFGCVGQSLGTISLGLLLAQFGWRSCYLLFAVPVLAWMAILAKTKIHQPLQGTIQNKENSINADFGDASSRTSKSPFKTLGFATLMVTMGLYALANGSAGTFMTTYMTTQKHLAFDIASIIFGGGPLVGIIGSLLGGYMGHKLGEKKALMLTYLGQVVFLLGLIVIPLVHLAVASFLIYQMFAAAVWIPASTIVANFMGKSRGGKAFSLFFFSGDVAGAVSPLTAGALITGFSIVSPFVFAIALLATNALLVRVILRD